MKTVLIYEDRLIGHRFVYLCKFIESFLNSNYYVICCSPIDPSLELGEQKKLSYIKIEEGDDFYTIPDKLKKKILKKRNILIERRRNSNAIKGIYFESNKKLLTLFMIIISYIIHHVNAFRKKNKCIKKLKNISITIKRISKKNNIDFCFFPNLKILDFEVKQSISKKYYDKYLYLPWGGLFIEASQLRVDKQLNLGFLSHPKHCRFILTLDSYIVTELEDKIGKEIYHVPDFIDIHTLNQKSNKINQIIEFANERKIILIIGALSSRKNIINFLKAINPNDSGVCFVIIGKIYENSFSINELKEIKKLVNRLPNQVFFNDYFIQSEEEYNSIIEISDVLFIAYKNFTMSSNLLTKASFFKKPIIASNRFLIGEQTRKFNLGMTINENSIVEIRDAVKRVANNKFYDEYIRKGMFDEYYKNNSIEVLNRRISTVFSSIQKESNI